MLSALNQNLAVTGKHADILVLQVHRMKGNANMKIVYFLPTVQEDEVEVDDFPVDPDVSYKLHVILCYEIQF